jgi:Late exocytosis, associated with Golgi transport
MVEFLWCARATKGYVTRVGNTEVIGSKLPALSNDLFAWIPQLLKITDDQILDAAGLDAFVVTAETVMING